MTSRGERVALAALAALCLLYLAGRATTYPSLLPDASYGLLVQKSMAAGAPWNFVTEPRTDDISQDETYFHTMWSPGQHVLPGLVMGFGLTLGDALRWLTGAVSLLALAGWYRLFVALGFAKVVALTAIVVLAASRTFSFSFLAYVGSDLLAFAGFPWLAWASWRLRHSVWLPAATPALLVAGFFLKNSLAITLAAWIAAVVTVTVAPRLRLPNAWLRLLAVGGATLAALWLIDIAYVSRGWTPISYQPVWSRTPSTYLLPSAFMVLAPTGLDDLLSRAFDNPSLPRVDYKSSTLLLLAVVSVTVLWMARELARPKLRERAVALAGFVALVAAAYTVLLATGSGASVYLSRHYVVPGAVLLPLMIERALHASRIWRVSVFMLLALPACYGVASFASNWWRHYEGRPASTEALRIAHLSIGAGSLPDIQALDHALPAGTLAVVPLPGLALEFSRTRVMATSAASEGAAEHERRTFRGRVTNLVVIAETAGQPPDEVRMWLRAFVDYDPARWSGIERHGLAYYVPDDQAVDVAWLQSALAR